MADTKIELQPITVPNFILVKPTGMVVATTECPKFPLHRLDDKVIQELIDQFAENLWRKVRADRKVANSDPTPR